MSNIENALGSCPFTTTTENSLKNNLPNIYGMSLMALWNSPIKVSMTCHNKMINFPINSRSEIPG